ncbi:MAG: NAD(+)/NADH kinase [Chlamydiales bacterium]|nr:NAD(+)/NADH kinase [Chlamydiales bacterium]
MIVALFPSRTHKDALALAERVLAFFDHHKVKIVVDDEFAKVLKKPMLSSISPGDINLMISMGGDGAILKRTHQYGDVHAPILGINLGHLGFMADIPLSEIEESLTDLINGEYTIQNRLILEGETSQGEKSYAINDIVIHRGHNPSLIELSIHVDGLYLNAFQADGLIISTPNGSTAYSLAAGGPILVPSLEAIVITPISPHTISNRPIVLSSSQTIEIKYLSHYKPVEVVTDGVDHAMLKTNETVCIHRSLKNFKLVNLNKKDFFSTLRTKLGWSGKLR